MSNLREQLIACFDKSELQSLCYDLSVNYDELSGDTLSDKVRSLITYCERRSGILELLTRCSQLRPSVSWNFDSQKVTVSTERNTEQAKRNFFVGHVYDKKLIDDLRDAIANAVKGTDWRPVYADEQLISGHILSDKIAPLIAECEFSLFEISNQTRPNVFIELGMALQQGKPVYLLMEKKAEPPSDLAGRDRIVYETYKELTVILRQKVFSQNPIALLHKYLQHTYHVNSISLKQDLSLIASGSGDHNAILWKRETREVQAIYKHDSWVGAVSFSPNAPYLATSDGKGVIRIWDINQVNHIVTQQTAHQGACRTVAFSPNGQFLASGGEDKKINIWSIPILEKIITLNAHTSEVRRLAFSPDGNKLASCGEDGKCFLVSIDTRTFQTLLENPHNLFRSVAYSSDGKLIAVTNSDGVVWLIQERLPDQWEATSIKAHEGPAVGLSIHPSNQIVATGGQDKVIRIWNVQTKKQIKSITGHEDSVTCLTFASNGKWLLSGSRDKSVCLWEV